MAAVSGGESSGIALLNPVNGTVDRMVESYSAGSQALGAYDGRYAVWEESHTAGSFDDYVVKEWDAATGSTTVVGGSHTDAHGAPIEGSEELPVIAGHDAAWLEAIKDDGESDLVVLDLRSGKRTVIRRAHANWIALTARTIVWSESLRPNAKTVIRAADLATGKATDPPAALAGVRGAWAFVTDGTAWVWIQGDRPTLYAATSSSAAPVKIGIVPEGGASPTLAISDDLATVPVSAGGMMLANLKTLAWAYEPRASFPVVSSGRLLVPELAQGKSPDAGTSVATLDPDRIGALACPR